MTRHIVGWPLNVSRRHRELPVPSTPAEWRQCQLCGHRNKYVLVEPGTINLAFCQPTCQHVRYLLARGEGEK